VDRQVTPTTPVQVTYQLTQVGRELMASLQPLVRWGLRWHGEQDQERSAGLSAHPARDSSVPVGLQHDHHVIRAARNAPG
jgi:hypothetical protein